MKNMKEELENTIKKRENLEKEVNELTEYKRKLKKVIFVFIIYIFI